MRRCKKGCACALVLCVTAYCGPGMAGNGLNVYGFGARSMGMGGADLATPTGVASIGINPAGLTGVASREAIGYLEGYRTFFRHKDDLGNDDFIDNPYGFLTGGGYARRWNESSPLSVGVALFAQGGAGFVYEDLANQFGTRDDLVSLFGVLRLAPSAAWRVNDRLSIGAALGINYSSAEQEFFKDTSLPRSEMSPGFQGFELKGADGIAFSGKLGLLYQVTPAWTVGMTYASKTPIKLEDGKLRLNYEADGIGRVTYRNARVEGLALPQEAGLGVAWTSGRRWLLAAEVNWIDQSSALKESKLSADSPNREGVPDRVMFRSPIEFRDQVVVAVGAEYQLDQRTRLRAGYNYGRNPVPDRNLGPTLNLVSEHFYGAGFSRLMSTTWELDGSFAFVPPVNEHYSNPSLGLGDAQSERWAYVDLNLTLTRRW